MTTHITESEGETEALGAQLAARLHAGDVVLISGDLGAGKTAFVRGLALGFGINPQEVSSPTFSLVHEYRGGTVTLYHADLYRLSATDAEALGLEDERVSRGVLVIEWPDRLTHPIAGATRIEIQVVGDTRRLLTTTIPSGSSAPLS